MAVIARRRRELLVAGERLDGERVGAALQKVGDG
jgi:hypothetical protein